MRRRRRTWPCYDWRNGLQGTETAFVLYPLCHRPLHHPHLRRLHRLPPPLQHLYERLSLRPSSTNRSPRGPPRPTDDPIADPYNPFPPGGSLRDCTPAQALVTSSSLSTTSRVDSNPHRCVWFHPSRHLSLFVLDLDFYSGSDYGCRCGVSWAGLVFDGCCLRCSETTEMVLDRHRWTWVQR